METEKPVWGIDHMSMLLNGMRNNIPENVRKKTWTHGMKDLDWNKIAFEPFSPEECQQKWQKIMQTIRKVRSLPELIADAEEGISNPYWRNNINPDYPKLPATSTALFYKENYDKLKKEYPNMKPSKLIQYAAEKYKMLSKEEKQKYEESYKLARKEYKRRVAEFRNHEYEVAELRRHSCGFALFYREQRALIADVTKSDCKIKWRNLTEIQRKEYDKCNQEMINDQEEKDKNSILFHKLPRTGYNLFCHEQRGSMDGIPNHPAEWKQRWDNLTEAQRHDYHRKWKEMRQEHGVKLNEFLEDFSVKQQKQILKKYKLKSPKLPEKRRRKEVTEFPGEPKKPRLGANTMFCGEQMKHLKEIKNPQERFSVVNQMWHHVREMEKAQYEQKVDERVQQYSEELKRWFKTLPTVEQQKYLRAYPSRRGYFVDDDEEVPNYQPSDSEDEDIEDSSSEDDMIIVEDEEQDDDVATFDMF